LPSFEPELVSERIGELRGEKQALEEALRKVEISATVSEAVANAFEKQKALPKEGSLVVLREVAGAGFEPATFGL
jgi:hypothetical protein